MLTVSQAVSQDPLHLLVADTVARTDADSVWQTGHTALMTGSRRARWVAVKHSLSRRRGNGPGLWPCLCRLGKVHTSGPGGKLMTMCFNDSSLSYATMQSCMESVVLFCTSTLCFPNLLSGHLDTGEIAPCQRQARGSGGPVFHAPALCLW